MRQQKPSSFMQITLSNYLDIIYKLHTVAYTDLNKVHVQGPYNTLANYPLVIEKMKQACRIHLGFLNHSMQILYNNFQLLCPQQQQNQLINLKSIAIELFYYHFQDVCQSNRTICESWRLCSSQQHPNDIKSLKTPINLSQSTMNTIALKQLIPNSQFVNIINTHPILIELLQYPQIGHKNHLLVLLPYFQTEHTKKVKKNNKKSPTNSKNEKQMEEVISYISALKIKTHRQPCYMKEEVSIEEWKSVINSD